MTAAVRWAPVRVMAIVLMLSLGACQEGTQREGYRGDLGGLPELQVVPVLDGYKLPLYVTHAPGFPDHLYVVEQDGRVELALAENGDWRAEGSFLDIRNRVLAPGAEQCFEGENHWEQGLLGLAFPPDHASTGHFYVTYTMGADCDSASRGAIVLSEFIRLDAMTADASSERILLRVDKPIAQRPPGQGYPRVNHNGGMVYFGPDGMLYISIGEGGTGGGPNAQSLQNYYGKLLRIDPRDPDGDDPLTYRVPEDNPFVGRGDALAEIWAYGLRNPWRWSFDRLTGDLWIGDVGQFRYEEIHHAPADSAGLNAGRGMNLGWAECEGAHVHSNTRPGDPEPARCTTGEMPIHEYEHLDGRCSITGGHVVRDSEAGRAQGVYLFGDLCDGTIHALGADGRSRAIVDADSFLSSFGDDSRGRLYVTDLQGGRVAWLQFADSSDR